MIKLSWCDTCKHITGTNGVLPTCDAFPNGVPYTFNTDQDVELKECNNGITYEPQDQKDAK